MAGKVILLAGFPGSGKSKYGEKLADELKVKYVDDYHENAKDHSPAFDHGREFDALVAGLAAGETWIASDREWCRPKRRREAEAALRNAVPGVLIEWRFLAIAEDVCRQGIKDRNRPTAEEELKRLDELAREYHVPPGSSVVESA